MFRMLVLVATLHATAPLIDVQAHDVAAVPSSVVPTEVEPCGPELDRLHLSAASIEGRLLRLISQVDGSLAAARFLRFKNRIAPLVGEL